MGDRVTFAERIELFPSLHAEPRFERVAGVVDPGMDNAAVMRARLEPRPRLAFKDTGRVSTSRYHVGGGQAHDSPAYDHNIDTLHVFW